MHTARILDRKDLLLSDIKTATAAGFFTELYLGGWYWGVVIGSVVYGVLLGALQLWAGRRAGPFWGLGLSFLTAYWAIRFDESHVLYVLYRAVLCLLVCLAFQPVHWRPGTSAVSKIR